MLAEEVTRSLYEFLVVYMHAVAYVCHVYPESSFKLVRQYGTATYQSRHPGVQHWIENAAQSLMKMVYSIDNNADAIISIAILENDRPSERFGIQIGEFITDSMSQTTSIDEEEIVEQYRSCVTKLLHSPRAPPSENDRSMTVFFEGSIDAHKNEEQLDWIHAAGNQIAKAPIRPIRTVQLGGGQDTILVMNLFRQSAIEIQTERAG